MITNIQQAINQVGKDAVIKSLGSEITLGYCDVHGHYANMPAEDGIGCPICPTNPANGTSATEVEHYIDLDPGHNLGTNPQQKVTHISQDVRGVTSITPATVPTTDGHRVIEISAPK